MGFGLKRNSSEFYHFPQLLEAWLVKFGVMLSIDDQPRQLTPQEMAFDYLNCFNAPLTHALDTRLRITLLDFLRRQKFSFKETPGACALRFNGEEVKGEGETNSDALCEAFAKAWANAAMRNGLDSFAAQYRRNRPKWAVC